ncbi:MAG: WYL domain-containing protein [Bacteroidota bacterium]|jgi:hypothetical protein
MEKEKLQTFRIRCICHFLDKGGGTLKAMHEFVNLKLSRTGYKPISLRTLQSCLEQLREGDFNHSKKNRPLKERSELFQVEVSKKNYRWHNDSSKPLFGDLEPAERYTLPFLTGILNKYKGIPAVKKILDTLPDIFGIIPEEMKSSSVIFHDGPTLMNIQELGEGFHDNVVRLAINMLGYIGMEQEILFGYVAVSRQLKPYSSTVIHRVAPLQIRLHDSLYYLTAIDLEKRKLSNFRIDRIANLEVEESYCSEGKPRFFNKEELVKKYKVNEHFTHVLGVWNHPPEDRVHRIHIRFKGWAASYIRSLKFHPTQFLQSIESEDPNTESLVMSFDLKLGPEVRPGQPIEERSNELSFFLGRFRNDAVVLKAEPL